MLTRANFWGIFPIKIIVHFSGGMARRFPKIRAEIHNLTPSVCRIVQRTLRNGTNQHFFQCNSLGTELKPVSIDLFCGAMLVFHGERSPFSCLTLQGYPIVVGIKFHYITDAAEPQRMRYYPHSSHDQQISALFLQGIIMTAGMFQTPLSLSLIHIFREEGDLFSCT